MLNINFCDLSDEYKSLIENITDKRIRKAYKMFNFSFFPFNKINNENDEDANMQIKEFLYSFLSKFKFITYHYSCLNVDNDNQKICNATICVEKQCVVIEQISFDIIHEIINKIEKQYILFLNDKNRDLDAIEEVKSFCNEFQKEIKSNSFVKMTIYSIIGFLIRRYYYPSDYFVDQSFFIYDKADKKSNEQTIIKELYDFLYSSKEYDKEMNIETEKIINQKVNDITHKILLNEKDKKVSDCIDFDENSFVKLRILFNNEKYQFYFCIHLDSFYVFMVKFFTKKGKESNQPKREIEFSKNFSHRCLTKFYGFVKKDGEIEGLVYEYMANGSISSCEDNNKKNKMFSYLTMLRVHQAIYYLHQNNLVYRDLKPSNILLDNNNVPFISDFETIRRPYIAGSGDTITNDIGSIFYSSPEQNYGNTVSYPADIYSFGLLIYYLIEGENMKKYESIFNDDEKILQLKKASNIIQRLYQLCVRKNQEERPLDNEIRFILMKEFNSFINYEHVLVKDFDKFNKLEIVNFIYELILINCLEKDVNELTKCFKIIICFRRLCLIKLHGDESFFEFNLGLLYLDGIDGAIEQDQFKAKKYFELSAEKNCGIAQANLGALYLNGIGVKQNYIKAKEYFELAASQNIAIAFHNLGLMYEKGYGVKKDYLTARQYYELAVKENMPLSLCNLGHLYEESLGVKKDYLKAKHYYELAAQQNIPTALCNLGILYFNGNGVEKNYTIAREYFEKSSAFNDSDALRHLGLIYLKGYGVQKNYSLAKKYTESAANLFNLDAIYNLGLMYEIGEGVKKDMKQAKQLYEIAAQQNYSDALFKLGYFYENGFCGERNYFKARNHYELSASQGNSDALFKLGYFYENGFCGERNYFKARNYYENSASQDNSNALVKLGYFYEKGFCGEQNYDTARDYYEISARHQNPQAFLYLGLIYINGTCGKKDYEQARKYFEKSAEFNNPEAFHFLGNIYAFGDGVNQDYNKAIKYYELAAKQNYPASLSNLAKFYMEGLGGIKPDYQKAIFYLTRSAELNNKNAFYNLGILYRKGWGVERDYSKALKCYQLAGPNNADALFNIGTFYFEGIGVDKNFEKAKEYFELAANLNDSGGLLNLGFMYFNGYGVEKDISRSIKLFESSAKQNNPVAINNLAYIYLYGIGIPHDYDKARYYYEILEKQNDSFASNSLGLMYIMGYGVKKDYSKAKSHFEKAAKLRDAVGYYNLGNLYFYGHGVEKNYKKAIDYYELAAKQNYSNAYLSLGNIYRNGNGVEQSYPESKKYFEFAAQLNNPFAFYFLGDYYSSGDFFDIDLEKAIVNFEKCSEIHNFNDQINCYSSNSTMSTPRYNFFCYRAMNDLGLLYLLFYDDIKNAYEYIKESAFGEYPFGQNNYGLLNQFYNGNINNVEYYYDKSSKSKFALAFYNLGFLKESTNNKIDDAIPYYIQASEYENQPLIFKNIEHNDKRLNISKTFIICFTNLKLVDYYIEKEKYEDAKKYFNKSFSKIKSESYQFQFQFLNEKGKNVFSYLKHFILNFPSFNLKNQPHLPADLNLNLNFTKSQSYSINTIELDKINETSKDKLINKEVFIMNTYEKKKSFKSDNKVVYTNENDLFEFVIKEKNHFLNEFVLEIKDIIQIMKRILYTQPYAILFGRISISKKKSNEKPKSQNITYSFYEGFGIE